MSVTNFYRLAPHRGMCPVVGSSIGNSDMRGGFSWSGLFSGISSGLNRVGNFIGNAARQVGNSQAFQQVKNGVIQSGVLENAGSLAGAAVSGLVDVGRLKLERDLQRLRDKAIAESAPPTIAYPTNPVEIPSYQPAPPVVEVPAAQPPVQVMPKQDKPMPLPSIMPDPVVEEPIVVAEPEAVPLGPYIPPSEQAARPPNSRRPRKRRRVSGWGAALNGMMGYGPGFYKRRYCF